jgi:ribonuclease P protein component
MTEPLSHTLSKAERLSGKTGISTLLKKGRYGNDTCLRFCYAACGTSPSNRILISVPKKLFKRAVKRNILKRRIRESYRLLKHRLSGEGIDIMFIYNSQEIHPFSEIYEAMGRILESINSDVNR